MRSEYLFHCGHLQVSVNIPCLKSILTPLVLVPRVGLKPNCTTTKLETTERYLNVIDKFDSFI